MEAWKASALPLGDTRAAPSLPQVVVFSNKRLTPAAPAFRGELASENSGPVDPLSNPGYTNLDYSTERFYMPPGPFVAREPELHQLQEEWEAPAARLLIVYGRRRVGKTRLITHWMELSSARVLYW